MADSYYNTGSVAANSAAVIAFMEAGLTATGWTNVDNPTTHRVWKSPDVNGAAGIYFFIDFFVNAGTLQIDAYVDYDVTNHTGISGGTGGAVSAFGGTGYVYANKLGLVYAILDGIANPILFFGQPRCRQQPNATDGLCLSTAGMSASATTVAVDRDLSTRLFVGQVVAIQNFAHNSGSANKDNRELVTITGITSTHLSFSATANAYDSGAKIGPPDMLWPLAGNPTGIRSFGSGTITMAKQIFAQDQTSTSTSANVGPLVNQIAGTGTQANASAMNAAGAAAEASNMLVSQPNSSNPAFTLGITGCIGVIPNYSGGAPADGAKFTDGVNVYAAPKGGTDPGGGAMTWLIGPTGDSPDRSTQVPILPLPLGHTDTIYMTAPPTGSAPTNALNQGFN